MPVHKKRILHMECVNTPQQLLPVLFAQLVKSAAWYSAALQFLWQPAGNYMMKEGAEGVYWSCL